ncbi:hypothetical protein [Flavobacterium solisilvae]|uniref:DNA topoisomerase IV n=1 Tax=Flavobacterium solisilvae TaxID=1852019 RepID=A0ABX1QU41_9FLAO|nr:hypothetical protein [Flavobacterium solisilvae]NMH25376.1 hypothetical protein [Flavobacterium solisilvae]
MKKLLILFCFVVMSSFSIQSDLRKLPDGNYVAVLDKQYKDNGLVDYEFTIKNDKFIIKIGNTTEMLDINWIDENSFIVKGYTEPSSPSKTTKNVVSAYRISFNITKQEGNEYHFNLGKESENDPVYSGKFVKFN